MIKKGKSGETNVATSSKFIPKGPTSKIKLRDSTFGTKNKKRKFSEKKNKTTTASKGKRVKVDKAAKGKCFHGNEDGH